MDSKTHALKQFYVAVGSPEGKLATLVDLLHALEAVVPLGLVVCCGARDSLDAVCVAAQSSQHTRLFCLHSNLSDREVAAAVEGFKEACSSQGDAPCGADTGAAAQPPERGAGGEPPQRRQLIEVLATTDSGLCRVAKEELPLCPGLLINFDLPTRKDAHLRRITSAMGSRSSVGGRRRIVVHFVECGRVEAFRQVEGFAEGRLVEEMPVHVADIFAS